VFPPREQVAQMALEHEGYFLHRFELGVDRVSIPLVELFLCRIPMARQLPK
jgi:hypothetical protein